MSNNNNLSETEKNRENLMKTIGLINDNQFDLEEASSQYNRDGMQATNIQPQVMDESVNNIQNDEFSNESNNFNQMNSENNFSNQMVQPQINSSTNNNFEASNNISNDGVMDNNFEQQNQNNSTQNYQKEYMELLSEFSKFRTEVKDIISGFNQNIYNLQSEITELKENIANNQKSQAVNYEAQAQQNNFEPTRNFAMNQNQGNMQMQNNIQSNSEIPIQNNTNNFAPQACTPTFQQSHQTVANEQPAHSQASHPRSGSFTPDDVKIENIFYYGNK